MTYRELITYILSELVYACEHCVCYEPDERCSCDTKMLINKIKDHLK